MSRIFVGILLAAIGVAAWLFSPAFLAPSVPEYALASDDETLERGRYLVNAGGCISCHEGEAGGLSGGMAIESPFGVFYASNITPDAETGTGGWSGSDYVRAIKHGRSPEGSFYFPAFPYRSYAEVTDEDALAIASWLVAQPAIANAVPAHDIPGWIGRWQLAPWNTLANLGEPEPVVYSDEQLARGAYLARNLGHCGECHTPRNALGISDYANEFGGGDMPDGHVPAINSEALSGWSEDDLALFLFLGLLPDGEYVGGKMEPVIEHNTGQLTDEDRMAMAVFFKRGL
ncbi:MAG: cytochrome c [Gammaproteobacteria bacterium]|nr:cytochrome c [Gammaproteobacteria bacterium]